MTDPHLWGGLLQPVNQMRTLLPVAASIIHISLRLRGFVNDWAQQAEEV